MSTYYYIACHDCGKYFPIVTVTASMGKGVHNKFRPQFIVDHADHNVQIFSEYDLEATPIQGYELEKGGD